MDTSLFDYDLPADRIASVPAERRDGSKLMVFDPAAGAVGHQVFRERAELLRERTWLYPQRGGRPESQDTRASAHRRRGRVPAAPPSRSAGRVALPAASRQEGGRRRRLRHSGRISCACRRDRRFGIPGEIRGFRRARRAGNGRARRPAAAAALHRTSTRGRARLLGARQRALPDGLCGQDPAHRRRRADRRAAFHSGGVGAVGRRRFRFPRPDARCRARHVQAHRGGARRGPPDPPRRLPDSETTAWALLDKAAGRASPWVRQRCAPPRISCAETRLEAPERNAAVARRRRRRLARRGG